METQFSPAGRMRRTSYVVTLAVLNLAMVGTSALLAEPMPGVGAIRGAMMLGLSWLLYCSMSRRLHDAGRKSTFAAVLLGCVALGSIMISIGMREDVLRSVMLGRGCIVIGAIIGLYILVAPPTKGPNAYGIDPRPDKRFESEEIAS